jgi:branched-subunit amino acid transport protein
MTLSELAVIIGMALAVYIPKLLPLVVVSESATERLRPWLRYLAPAVLGALVGPAIVAPSGQPAGPGLVHLPFVVAFLTALIWRKMVPALAAGLLAVALVALVQH